MTARWVALAGGAALAVLVAVLAVHAVGGPTMPPQPPVPAHCTARGSGVTTLPDPTCTPGATNTPRPGPHSVRFADVQSARWCDGWLLVAYDIEMADRTEVAYLPDDGSRTLRLRGRSGRFGPSGVGWVDVRDGPGSPGEGRLHVRASSAEVASTDPDMVEVVYHGVTSAPVPIEDGCPTP